MATTDKSGDTGEVSNLRAYMIAELSRIRDDISDLYEKVNEVKDLLTQDKLALLSQLNQQFSNIESRFANFMLTIQQLDNDIEKSDDHAQTALAKLMLDIENRMLQIRAQVVPEHHGHPDVDKRIHDLEHVVDGSLSKSDFDTFKKTEFAKLKQRETKLASTVTSLTWKVGLILAALTIVGKSMGLDMSKILSLSNSSEKTETKGPK